MLYKNANSRHSRGRHNWGRHRNAIAFACLWPVVVAGCGFRASASRTAISVEIIRGKDSAGATIELEKRGADLTQARVIDVVLGTGEAEIIYTTDSGVEFTIDFPAGVTVTYLGSIQAPSVPSAQAVAGTWTQHARGIFGEDTGTWEASSSSG